MKQTKLVYTKDLLEEHVPHVFSYAGLARSLGRSPVGGTTCHLKRVCTQFKVDTSHFTSQRWSKGKTFGLKKSPSEYLVETNCLDRRQKARLLTKCLIQIGRDHICELCGVKDTYNGRSIVLEVDHKDNQYWNNQQENIRFLCPNCHSQETKLNPTRQSRVRPPRFSIIKREPTVRRSPEQYREDRSIKYKAGEQRRIQSVLDSNIDFSKMGWVKQVSELISIKEGALGRWMRRNMADFYKEKCYQRKSRLD
jgi:Zn finger protein HypA/HybF involved in hydrogenase expression